MGLMLSGVVLDKYEEKSAIEVLFVEEVDIY